MKILSEGYVCDGYDVAVLRDNGRRHTFHFSSQPKDVKAAIAPLLTELAESEARQAEQDAKEEKFGEAADNVRSFLESADSKGELDKALADLDKALTVSVEAP